jgi:Mycothiol maleylpyruvate isomerase N-terminal domain
VLPVALARLLEGLSDDEWEQPSLCAGWRVCDVAAHVSLCALPPSPGSMLVDLIRAHGNMHQLNTLVSRRRAERARTANRRPAPARWLAQNPRRV